MTDDDIATLAPAMGGDADLIVAEVEAGAAKLLAYPDGSRIVVRLETGEPSELVIVAGAGCGALEKVEALASMADRQGWSVRFHTRRPALGRLLGRLGFIESERVYRYGR